MDALVRARATEREAVDADSVVVDVPTAANPALYATTIAAVLALSVVVEALRAITVVARVAVLADSVVVAIPTALNPEV